MRRSISPVPRRRSRSPRPRRRPTACSAPARRTPPPTAAPTWASAAAGAVTPLSVYGNNTFTTNTNVDVSGSQSPATFTANSLRFNSSATTLTLTGLNTFKSGGRLVTTSGNGATIAGGSLTSSQNELLVHTYGDVTINSGMAATGGRPRPVPARSPSAGTRGLNAPVNVNRGNLTLTPTPVSPCPRCRHQLSSRRQPGWATSTEKLKTTRSW